MHQHLGFALGLQTVQHAGHAHRLAGQHGLAQLEHVVAGHIEHGVFNLLIAQNAVVTCGMQQPELLDFLMCSQQIAFHPVRKKLQRALAFFTARHALALLLQPLGDPLRQVAALYRVKLHRHAVAVKCAKPGTLGCHAVQPGQNHQRQRVRVALRALGDLLQIGGAVLAGLACGNADLDDLLVGEQTQRAAAGQHRAPVKVRTLRCVHRAFRETLLAGGLAQRIRKFLHQQRLVPMQGVQAFQPALQVLVKLDGGQVHARSLAAKTAPGRPHSGITWRGSVCPRSGFQNRWRRAAQATGWTARRGCG